MITRLSKVISPLFFALSVCLLLSPSGTALGQDQQPSRSNNRGTRSEDIDKDSEPRRGGRVDVVISSNEDYRLAPSDVIKISIEDAPELSGNYVISRSGVIPMKYLGPTKVTGRTPDEVSTLIADGLKNRYLKDPKVYVSVEQYNSRQFFIQGAVRSPGVYIIQGRPTLFKLITIAGGFSGNYGSTAYIFREKKVDAEKLEKLRAGQQAQDQQQNTFSASAAASPSLAKALEDAKEPTSGGTTAIEGESEYELITATIRGLFIGRFDQNLLIQPNDLVFIPQSDIFFVAGEVKAPGQYTLRDGMTLRQAIALAQGTFFKSATDRGIIFRTDPATGKLNQIPVDIGAVVEGKKPDIPIMPNDVITVPNSKVKSFGGALFNAIAGSAVYRVPGIGR